MRRYRMTVALSIAAGFALGILATMLVVGFDGGGGITAAVVAQEDCRNPRAWLNHIAAEREIGILERQSAALEERFAGDSDDVEDVAIQFAADVDSIVYDAKGKITVLNNKIDLLGGDIKALRGGNTSLNKAAQAEIQLLSAQIKDIRNDVKLQERLVQQQQLLKKKIAAEKKIKLRALDMEKRAQDEQLAQDIIAWRAKSFTALARCYAE